MWLVPSLLLLAAAQDPVGAARSYQRQHRPQILDEYVALLKIPNTAAGPENLRRNAEAIRAMLARRGVQARLLEHEGAPPVVYGELKSAAARRTVIFYAHYDGQAVEGSRWSPSGPFEPSVRDGRLYARSASDDKAPIMAIAAALDAYRAAGLHPAANLKFFFEGEEEAGSPHLRQFVERYHGLLAGDVWLICDGPVHQSRRMQIAFGVRGIATVRLTAFGPAHDLHSGHYGNWAPNPAMLLARLLASMKDDTGRVLIEDFYRGIEPLAETERRALKEVPPVEDALRREFLLGATDGAGRPLAELINLPSLNVRGLASGSTGNAARTIIPSRATAEIDMRLVKGIEPVSAVARLRKHIERQGWFIVSKEPDAATRLAHPRVLLLEEPEPGYPAARTSMDLDISRAAVRAVEAARGPSIKLPTMGGSVPLYIFADLLKTPTIGIPIVNHDNNQHGANENLRLENLWEGIETLAALMSM